MRLTTIFILSLLAVGSFSSFASAAGTELKDFSNRDGDCLSSPEPEIFSVIKNGTPDELRQLIEDDGVSPNIESRVDFDELYNKAEKGTIDDARRFINNVPCFSPLICAAKLGKLEHVKVLVAAGAVKDYQDVFGYTALYYAADLGFHEIVQYLLDEGANSELVNAGATVLNVASIKCAHTLLWSKDRKPRLECVKRLRILRKKALESGRSQSSAMRKSFRYNQSRYDEQKNRVYEYDHPHYDEC